MRFRSDITMYNMPPPGSGLIMAFILNIMDAYSLTPESLNSDNAITTYHRIVEAMKFAYAKRTHLGDAEYVDVTQVRTEIDAKITYLGVAENRHKG